ncbi:MAG: DUF4159 domain-containing protein [Phycisphaerales bacterium]|nr:MAG: DUF4159 domain-containing protein [Phycisphaerales bacterium]
MKDQYEYMNRRQFLRKSGGIIAGAALASARVGSEVKGAEPNTYPDNGPDDLDKYDFLMPRVKFTHEKREVDRWDVRPGGDANLLRELSSAIRCRTKPVRQAFDWHPQWAIEGQLNAVVSFEKLKDIEKYPFLFMTGENPYKFDDREKANLKEYILRGGFLLMDDCVYLDGGDFFYKSSYALLEEVFGSGSVKRIRPEHEVFHNVYDLSDTGLPPLQKIAPVMPVPMRGFRRPSQSPLPHMAGHGQNHGARGVFIGDRLAIFLSSTDLHCGWCDSRGATFGRASYEKTIQMGINIIMYAISH